MTQLLLSTDFLYCKGQIEFILTIYNWLYITFYSRLLDSKSIITITNSLSGKDTLISQLNQNLFFVSSTEKFEEDSSQESSESSFIIFELGPLICSIRSSSIKVICWTRVVANFDHVIRIFQCCNTSTMLFDDFFKMSYW